MAATRSIASARVSGDVQAKEGTIESQVLALKKQIAAAGHKLAREYIDNGFCDVVVELLAGEVIARLPRLGRFLRWRYVLQWERWRLRLCRCRRGYC